MTILPKTQRVTQDSTTRRVELERPQTESANSRRGLTHQIGTSDWRAEMHSTRRCSVNGCGSAGKLERGMCHTHYEFHRRNGLLPKLPHREAVRPTTRTLKPGEPIPEGSPGRYLSDRGYVRLRWRVAPSTYIEVYEHRLNAGLPEPHLHVHHINGYKNDNRPSNLLVLTATDHQKLHSSDPEWVARTKASRPKRQPLSTYPRCRIPGCDRAAQCVGRTVCLKHYKAMKRQEAKP